MRSPSLLAVRRMSRLGELGETLAAEALSRAGFQEVENLNTRRTNHPFADILAARNGTRYLIGVKTRNEMREGDVGLNASYNLVLISKAAKIRLESQGKATGQITALLLDEVHRMAAAHDAVAAWVTVAVRPKMASYSAYFGEVRSLGDKRSVPMTHKARASYLCLADDQRDDRITEDLLNLQAA
jgi:Holliday junction resolvase-like predicted endonuclease